MLSVACTALGFVGVAIGFTVMGALLMSLFRGAMSSLGPATVVQATARDASVIAPLARMQAWRDLGAAIGPLLAGMAIGYVSPMWLHGFVATSLMLVLLWWIRGRIT